MSGLNSIEPEEYEYLWTDHDVDFIFTSCYLFPKFKDTDFILIYDHEQNGLHFFLSKHAHERCAEYGPTFLTEDFNEWKQEIQNNIHEGNELIEQTNEYTPSELDDATLASRIRERADLFQSLGQNYFYTEFFFMDEVDEIIDDPSTPREQRMADNAEKLGEIKYEARDVLNTFYDYHQIFKPYVEEAMRRTGREDLRWQPYDDIIRIINGDEVPKSNLGEKDWAVAKKTNWNVVTGEKAARIKQAFEQEFFEQEEEQLEGTPANQGKHKGVVKVLPTVFSDRIKEEMKKVKEGDVLVANTTGPEVMPACERAGAIITDEGGITSHAAIVSRELGIPCIVGTEVATQVFNDGDMVEVDAEQGEVRRVDT